MIDGSLKVSDGPSSANTHIHNARSKGLVRLLLLKIKMFQAQTFGERRLNLTQLRANYMRPFKYQRVQCAEYAYFLLGFGGGGGGYCHRTKPLTGRCDPGGVPLFCFVRGTKEKTGNNPIKLKRLHPPFHLDPRWTAAVCSSVHSTLMLHVVVA